MTSTLSLRFAAIAVFACAVFVQQAQAARIQCPAGGPCHTDNIEREAGSNTLVLFKRYVFQAPQLWTQGNVEENENIGTVEVVAEFEDKLAHEPASCSLKVQTIDGYTSSDEEIWRLTNMSSSDEDRAPPHVLSSLASRDKMHFLALVERSYERGKTIELRYGWFDARYFITTTFLGGGISRTLALSFDSPQLKVCSIAVRR